MACRAYKTLIADLWQALSVTMRKHTLEAAARNVLKLRTAVDRCKQTNADRLTTEYNRLVSGLQARGLRPERPRTMAFHGFTARWSVYSSWGKEKGAQGHLLMLSEQRQSVLERSIAPTSISAAPELFLGNMLRCTWSTRTHRHPACWECWCMGLRLSLRACLPEP